MWQHTYNTAVGHYLRKTDEAGRTYPVVNCHQKEYSVDLQEMTLWTALNWRFLDRRQDEQQVPEAGPRFDSDAAPQL
jgi:hypothetical protein